MKLPLILEFDHDSKGTYTTLKFVYGYEDGDYRDGVYPLTTDILWFDEDGAQLVRQYEPYHIDINEFIRAIIDGTDII